MNIKKYDIYDLFVVKVDNAGTIQYFICCLSGYKSNTYIEVLNKTEIKVQDESCVKPLVGYYSPLAVRNYTTGKTLKLTKEDIFKKCIEINVNYAIMRYEDNINKQIDNNAKMNNLEERLNKATEKFFPKSGCWSASEFSRHENSLIGNLRNDLWLATELQKCGLEDVFFGTILNYVKSSAYFKEKRAEYEQVVVKWQIGWMISGGDGWLVSDEFSGDFICFDENCDIGFRLGIVRTLEAIGINTDAIEEGIEANVDLWRTREMDMAFRNQYNPILSLRPGDLSRREEPSEEHRTAWLKMRLYQYYQDHKDSVDKYGKVTPEMEMTPEEVEDLRQYLAKMHDERMTYLEEFAKSESPTEPPKILTKTMNG